MDRLRFITVYRGLESLATLYDRRLSVCLKM